MSNWQRVFSVLQAVPSPRPLFSCWAKDFISCNLTYLFLFPELFRKLLPMIISWRAPFMFSSSRFKFSSHPRKLLIHSVIFFHRAWWFKWAMFPQRPRCLNISFPGAGSVWGGLGGVVLLEEVFPGGGLWESIASPYSQFALCFSFAVEDISASCSCHCACHMPPWLPTVMESCPSGNVIQNKLSSRTHFLHSVSLK